MEIIIRAIIFQDPSLLKDPVYIGMMYHVALGSCMYVYQYIYTVEAIILGNRLRYAYRMTTLLIVVVLTCRVAR